MKPLMLLLAIMAAAWMIAPARSQDDANPKLKDQNAEAAKEVADPADKIKELQNERIAALREYADMRAELYSKARAEAKDAYKPRLLLLNAEVELAEAEADRIALFKGAIDDLNKLEEIAKDRVKSARGRLFSTLQFKTQRLGVEIELKRAKANQAQEAQRPKDENAEAAEKVADPADKIKELQKERIATLREYADVAAELYSKARVETADAIEARLLLLKAEVEVAESEADRITLLKGAIDDLNKVEQIAVENTGKIAAEFYLLQIETARLGVEIELERAKANQAPADKIKELQEERIAALRECAGTAAELCGKGRLEPIEAIDARLLLLKAEVEVAESEADRITLFKGAIDDLNKLEEIVKKYGVEILFLQNKTARLGVEIELERAKANQGHGLRPEN